MTRIQPWTHAELMRNEQVFEALVAKAVRQTVKTAVAPLTAAAELPLDPAFESLESSVQATWTGYVDRQLFPFLTETFVSSAERVTEGVAQASGVVVDTLTNTYAQSFLEYAYNRMVATGEQLWQKIRAELVAGQTAGESVDQIAARLVDVAELALPRALTVARTEVISAANAGSYLQMIEAGFEEEVTKVWLATEDPRTRESHRHADDQGVPLTGEFSVDIYKGDVKTGTEGMEFPGDPVATPGNIINCRCSLAFDFSEDEVLVAAFIEKQHPRDGDGKFKKKGAADKYIKVPDAADKPANSAPMAEKVAWMVAHKWDSMAAGQKGVLIKNIDEAIWQKLPPELKDKVLDAPSTTSHPEAKHLLEQDIAKLQGFKDEPDDEPDTDAMTPKAKAIAAKLPVATATWAATALHSITQKDWDSMPKAVQNMLAFKAQNAMHPKTKAEAKEKLAALGWQKPAPVTPALPDAPARPTGGVVTKTGKSWTPGQPVAMKVQFLYNTTFADGAVMAVRKDSDERLVWNGTTNKIDRQKKGADGKYATTESATRGDFYKKYKDEDGWTIPTLDDTAATPAAAIPAVGKPVKIKVQLIYQTPFDDGDIVAVNPTTGETIHWDAKKKRMVVTSELGTTDYTRGALYKQFKDEDGWHLPLDKKGAPIVPAPVPAKKAVPPAKSAKPKAALTPEDLSANQLNTLKGIADLGSVAEFEPSPAKGMFTLTYPTLIKNGWVEQYKDENDLNWEGKPKSKLRLTQKGADFLGVSLPAPTKKTFQPVTSLGGENTDKLKAALSDPYVTNGTVLFDQTAMGQHTVITKIADGEAQVVVDNGDPATVTVDDAWDTANWLKAIGTSKKSSKDKDAAAVAVSTYVASDDSNAIYQAWDTAVPGEIWSNGPFSVGLSKNGNLLFLDATPGGGVGVVKSADVNSENIDKALEAVMAGKSWTVDDGIPEVDPDEISAPGGSDGVSAGQSVVADSTVEDIKDGFDSAQENDLLFENDDLIVEKYTDTSVIVKSKKNPGYDATYSPESLTAEHLNDFTELAEPVSALMPVTPANTAVSADKAATIKNWSKQSDIPAGEELHNGADFKIVKGSPGAIIIYPKGPDGYPDTSAGSAQVLFGDEITSQGIQNTLSQMGLTGGGVVSPVVAPAAANVAVTNKPLTSPATQLPLKMSYGLLVNPKTTNYKDGQIIAENPGQNERLVWDGINKKFLVQVQGSSGDWTQVFKYSKQAAYKNLKDDTGWMTPSTPFVTPGAGATPGTAPTPSVHGAPSAPVVSTPAVSTGIKPKFSIDQLNAVSDAKISSLSDDDVKKVFNEFKTGTSTMYLTSSEPELLNAVLRAQKKHNDANPGVSLNMLETIALVDSHSAKVASVANSKLYQKKILDWLGTPAGKKKASEVIAEFRMSPAEKAKLVADKKAAAKADLDLKLKDFHAIRPTLGTPEIQPKNATFEAPSVWKMQQIQDAVLAQNPWTPAQKSALRKYTGSYYHSLNGMLRGSVPPTPELLKDASNAQKGMRPLAVNILTFRGTGVVDGIFPGTLAEYKDLIGKTAVEPGFFSTSVNKPFGGKIKIEFEIPQGTPAAWVENYTDKDGSTKKLTNVSNENEVLLAAGTKFEYISAQQQGDKIVVRVRVVP